MCPVHRPAPVELQYHSANAITLVAQMAAPEASSAPAPPVACPFRIARISSTADVALAAVSRKISTRLAHRTKRARCSMRTGLEMASPTSSPPSRIGISHLGSGRSDNWSGRTCSTMATITVTLYSRRGSPGSCAATRADVRPAPLAAPRRPGHQAIPDRVAHREHGVRRGAQWALPIPVRRRLSGLSGCPTVPLDLTISVASPNTCYEVRRAGGPDLTVFPGTRPGRR